MNTTSVQSSIPNRSDSGGAESVPDFLPFDESWIQAHCEDSERLQAIPSLLDLTGVTSHKSFDEVERQRWLQGQQMAGNLMTMGLFELASKLQTCHSFQTVRKCDGCHKVLRFWNRCDIFYCPQCSPRLSKMRLDGLTWWTDTIKQPKHLVLTFRNVDVLTADYVAACKKSLAKFRRRRLFRHVTGGLWAMEITNKGNGWHLHFHLVIDSPWMDVRLISEAWAESTGDGSNVVWIQDASRGGLRANLPRYVTKYCGKGFRPHDWTPEMLAQFVASVSAGRTFGVFGSLLGQRETWREFLQATRTARRACECGCTGFHYFSEHEFQWATDFTGWGGLSKPRPPSAAELSLNLTQGRARVWPD